MLGSRILCFTRFVKLYLNCVTIITLFHYSAQFFAYWQNFYAYNIFKNILIKLTTAARGRHSLVRPDNNSYNNVWEVTERLFPPREHHSLVRRPVATTFKMLKREIRHGEGGGGRGWGQGASDTTNIHCSLSKSLTLINTIYRAIFTNPVIDKLFSIMYISSLWLKLDTKS